VEEFKCEESARNARGYCPFHGVIYPIMTEEEGMRGMIIDKINRWFSEEEYKRKPLKFIGYNIPGMDLSEYFTEDTIFQVWIFLNILLRISIFANQYFVVRYRLTMLLFRE